MKGKKTIWIFLLILIILGVAIAYFKIFNRDDSGFDAEPLPETFPVPEMAEKNYGRTSGKITHYSYTVPLEVEEVMGYYNNMSEDWVVEKDWFEKGDGFQKHFHTKNYTPGQDNRSGRQVQVVVSPKRNETKLVIVSG